MSVYRITQVHYVCRCDRCHKMAIVPQTAQIYNGAQAVRSLGWSYGKDKSVYCDKCRKQNWKDRHIQHFRVAE